MRTTPKIAISLTLALSLGLAGCAQDEGADGADADTLEVAMPENAGERLEEAGRDVGEAIGEGMEATGEAIEGAGREIQEEMREGEADTVHM